MKILVVHGSPRKGGNTVKYFEKTFVRQPEDEIRTFFLVDFRIHPCTGCLACSKTGECPFEDDMNLIYEGAGWADRLVFTTPVYFNSVTSYMKVMMDRFQRDYARRFILGTQKKVEPHKKGLLFATAGSKEKHREFDGLRFPVDLMFKSQGIRDYTIHLLDGVDDTNMDQRLLQQEKLYT
ncbi:MAG: hypothetical protein AVO33_00810 [delta proteobacterium ML8_F1]|nr:MAG: hypothetical protein AVO33_00810 [delta proteobacterium ML8_F1]